MFLVTLINIIAPILNTAYLVLINRIPGRFGLFTIIFAVLNALFGTVFIFYIKSNQKVATNLLSYFLFVVSVVISFIFLKNQAFKVIFYVLFFVLSLLNIFHIRYLIKHKKENYFLNDINYFTFLISSFLITSSLLAFNIFIGLNKILITFFIFLYFFIFYFCIYYYYATKIKDVYKYIFVSSLISTEIFVAVSYLPYSFYVNAFMVLLFNFLLASVSKDYLLNKFNLKYYKRLIIICMVLLALVLITAKTV